MSLYLMIGLAWFALALLGWSWLVAVAHADRARERPPRSRPRR